MKYCYKNSTTIGPSHRLTADKREIKDPPKLPSAFPLSAKS